MAASSGKYLVLLVSIT